MGNATFQHWMEILIIFSANSNDGRVITSCSPLHLKYWIIFWYLHRLGKMRCNPSDGINYIYHEVCILNWALGVKSSLAKLLSGVAGVAR